MAQILADVAVTEILDGRKSRPPRVSEMFAQFVAEGRTITKIEFIDGQPEDDDWVDITFGPSDPAVSPLRVSRQPR
ncbi:hypothetical protein LB535_22530 [Mesorhizobium sp. CA10]|uniref:hypothetical protein n=1 Tax=Mesorhizobium sp. CA10 TaxID=588495 RepID=UPI001CCFF8A1|nr:hypothetical protein [Mesorhizobium sp. CA10]MBZ9885123.1 hypothetical protein [Mesorhizobium sp. CA10]